MRTLAWSLRRELWEHRWVSGVAAACGIILLGLLAVAANEADAGRTFDVVSRLLLITATVVSFIYCAEAVRGELADRSVYFWKSLPVSDATAVAAKAIVVLLVIPAFTLVLLLAAQAVARVAPSGLAVPVASPLWTPDTAALEVLAATLLIAPVCAWIMLVSSVVRRGALLIAFLPAVLIGIVERVAAGSTTIADALFQRGVGRHWIVGDQGIVVAGEGMMTLPAEHLLASTGLWYGVVATVALFAMVVRVRHRRPGSV